SPNGSVLSIHSLVQPNAGEPSLEVWDVRRGEIRGKKNSGWGAWSPSRRCFNHDGTSLFELTAVSFGGTVWRPEPDTKVVALDCADPGLKELRVPPFSFAGRSLACSADGRRLVVWGHSSNKLTLLDAATLTVLQVWKTPFRLIDVALNGDGTRVFAVSGSDP